MPEIPDAVTSIGLEAFGGSNSLGLVNGISKVILNPEDNCLLINKNIFGGGNEAEGGDAFVTIPCSDKVYSAVYGGAKRANTGNPSNHKNIVLNIEGSTIDQVFAGNMDGGTVYGDVHVNIYGGTIGEVFGGSNRGGRIEGVVTVLIDSSNCSDYCPLNVDYVYGGGNECSYDPSFDNAKDHSPFIYLRRGTVNKAIFGGGKGTLELHADTAVTSNPTIVIGSDSENFPVQVGTSATMTLGFGDIYGGGSRMPVVGNTYVVVDGSKTRVFHNIYGGGNQAKVTGNTDVRVGDPSDKSGSNAIALPAGLNAYFGETHYGLEPGTTCKSAPVTP